MDGRVIDFCFPNRWQPFLSVKTQYAAAFFEQYKHKFKEMFPRGLGQKNVRLETTAGSTDNADSKESNVALWIANAMRSLPTNEDLRKTYFWESRRLGAQESEKHASEKRLSRLKRLWKAQWHSSIRLRVRKAQEMSDDEKNNALQWKPAFAMIQGHRFLWWDNVADFDNGELPVGRLFLSGHAGLTQPSPIEMREIPSKELPLIVSIFGRGPHGQERATILTLDSNVKEELENTVQEASFKDE